jgi:hypothetical protein
MLHFLNVRDSFVAGEEGRWTWETTKRQLYRLVFHRMVSLETKRCLEDILRLLTKDDMPEYRMSMSLFKLYSGEMVYHDITGYKNGLKLASTQDTIRDDLYKMQKLFESGLKTDEDEEEKIANVILTDEAGKKSAKLDEKDSKADSDDDNEADAKDAFTEDDEAYLSDIARTCKELEIMNTQKYRTINLFRNKHMVVLRDKLSLIDNYFEICSTMITNAPGSIAKS